MHITHPVAAPGILSRVFLFHFEKILGHFGLFWVFRDVLINTGWNSKFDQHEVCAKKKKILKTKTNLHSVHWKPQKEKKMKIKEMNKSTYTINYKFIWNINKIINYCCLVISLICLSFINYNLLYCCFINY